METNWKEHAMSLTIGDKTRQLLGCIGMLNDISSVIADMYVGEESSIEPFHGAVCKLEDEILQLITIRMHFATSFNDTKEI